MKHRIGFNRLGRRQAHRNAMKNNMVTSLFRYERVQTTKAKALEVKRAAEKMVTRARVDSVHNRRIVAERIHDKEIVAKLFTEIAPRYLERPGGYTRVLKTGFRQGDAAEMVILELVDRKIEEKVRPQKEAAKVTEAVEAGDEAPTEDEAPKAKSTKSPGGSKKPATKKAAESEEAKPADTETVDEAPKAEESEEAEAPTEAEAETAEKETPEEADSGSAEAAPKDEAAAPDEASDEDSEKKD